MNYPPYYSQFSPAFGAPSAFQAPRQEPGQGYPQPQQMAPAPPQGQGIGFLTRPVTSREEALGAQVDFFGPGTLMPDLAHGKIYLKKFNANTGASDLFTFALDEPGEKPVPKSDTGPEYALKEDVDKLREGMERLFDELDRMRRPERGGKRLGDE